MAANDNVVGCGKEFSVLELLSSIFGKDASNNVTIRLYDSNSVSGSKLFNCNTPVSPQDLEAAIKAAITLDANGDPALRVSLL